MKYHDSYDESRHIMQQALKLLDDHELAYNPVNYAVAYQYSVGTNFPLIGALDKAIEDQSIDPYLFETLFHDYILEPARQDNRHFYKLDSTIESLHAASQNTTSAVNALDTLLGRHESANQEKVPLREVAESASKIKAEHDQLVAQVELAKTESEAIKTELAAAKLEAITDPLTGLQNRQGMTRFFNRIIKDADNPVVTAAIIDIDYFKKVNDSFGHLAGDLILKRLGKLLADVMPSGAQAFRFGGEEFVVVLHGHDVKAAKQMAEKLRHEVTKLRFKSAKTKELLPSLSVSIGLAQRSPSEDMNDLLVRADDALYSAKNNGRNQVVCH